MVPQEAADQELARDNPEDAVALSELLDQLARAHPDWCTVVEMKHFLGFTDEEMGQELGMPLRTVQRIWHDARKWLFDRREKGPAPLRSAPAELSPGMRKPSKGDE
jgi:DNA-directed RNA polymerase specialized sigma24 family protein